MASSNDNPFVMPGMGQSNPDIAGNPLLASLEMMRQAWSGLTGPGGLASALPMTAPLNLEELDRRIAELKSVESWLTMNLSMLSSTIQGMEVQRSTINTLRSFVDAVSQSPLDPHAGQSPLEAVLGIRRPASAGPAPSSGSSGSGGSGSGGFDFGSASGGHASNASAESPGFSFGTPDDVAQDADAKRAADPTDHASQPTGASEPAGENGAGLFPGAQAAQSASQAWFDMLQQQFNSMAQATAAATANADSMKPAGRAGDAGSKSSPGSAAKPAAESSPRSATKSAARSATNSAARSTTKSPVESATVTSKPATKARSKPPQNPASKTALKTASKNAPKTAPNASPKSAPQAAPKTARKTARKSSSGGGVAAPTAGKKAAPRRAS